MRDNARKTLGFGDYNVEPGYVAFYLGTNGQHRLVIRIGHGLLGVSSYAVNDDDNVSALSVKSIALWVDKLSRELHGKPH